MTTQFYYNGASLASFGSLTLLDDFLDTAEGRGENITIPFRDGATFVEKFWDERTLQFGMTLSAPDTLGVEVKMDDLRRLLGSSQQKTLSMQRADGVTRTVLASVRKPLQVSRPAPWVAQVVLEFELTEPYWRSDTLTTKVITIDASPKTDTIENLGSVVEHNPTILLTGPLQDTVITNTDLSVSLTYTGTISAGHTVTIYRDTTGEFVATHSVSGDVIGNISHSGAASLFVLEPGTTNLSITDSTATTGTVTLSFYPPHF